ncbi:tetratricopeptide repeat-containing sensor histidine kinase [Algibacter sp.]|uniref:tetratricopeptide repeat-containing sensor histidine kinase n=1 Tax=Algibacter sp. TaxID=1872428 RepID=UPI003C76FA96
MRLLIIKKVFIFLCLASFLSPVFSQNKVIDSLKIKLQSHKEKDTTRVNLLNSLAFSYFSKDMSKTLEYLEEADTIAEVIHFKKGKARSIYIRGITEAVQSNYDQALSYYNEALKLYEIIDFQKGAANCYNAIGITYKNKGDLRKSIAFFKKAIRIEEKIGSKNLSASLLNLGTAYSDLGEFVEAISPLKKSLSIAKADKNEQRVAYSLNNLGTIYSDQGNYPLALEHYKESLYINEKLGDSIGIANHLNNIGTIYKTQKYYDKAMSYYEKSLEINKRINRKRGISGTLNDIGTIYEEIGDYRSAIDYYVDALHISKQTGAKSDIPNMLINIGEVYLILNDYRTANQYYLEAKKISIEIERKYTLCGAYIGLARTYANQKQYRSALSNVLKAKKISKKAGFLEYQKEASEILSNIYKATGNYKNAFESHQQFKILNDSLFNKENIEKITQLEYEYKYKQALDSASIRELKLTKTVQTTSQDLEKSQRNYLWAIIGVLLISILLGAIIFYQKLRNAKSKTQNAIMEQKLLRSQMTPHFIFNSLSVLQGMILNKEEKKSVHYLSKFSKLLRITLENSRDKTVSLSHELRAIQDYLTLQNLENEAYEFTILVEDSIDVPKLEIPPMLIQPFVENAIEHAFINHKENRKIDIRLMYTNDVLVCTISDNGVGVNYKNGNKRKGKKSLATTITTERLKILSKDLHMQGSLMVEDLKIYGDQGTIVTLEIPHKII